MIEIAGSAKAARSDCMCLWEKCERRQRPWKAMVKNI